ncbi:MAG: hypothetical protein P1U36_06235 [Legionellaceae bacterium]|nr:hypothetical protein [Legionellaceae bacterium]
MSEDKNNFKKRLIDIREDSDSKRSRHGASPEEIEKTVGILNEISEQFKTMKFDQLAQQRAAHGFNHFVFDLKDPSHNSQGNGWSLNNGMLHVDHTHFQNDITRSEIHALLNQKLGDRPWYQIPSNETNISNYGIAIKTLGKNGLNSAVDPILLVQETAGKVSVLSGQRPVCHEYCLPGGMNESTVINTCVSELLEECFSGALFEPGEKSSRLLNESTDNISELNAYISTLCPEELKTHIAELPTDMTASNAVQNAMGYIQESALDEGKKAPLIAKIKRTIYQERLPEQFARFFNFVNQHIDQTQDHVVNGSDPRNTDAAYMETKPLPGFIKIHEMDAITNQCALTFGAGDDLGNVRLRDIDVFCGHIVSTGNEPNSQQQGTYSDHASLVLHSVALGLERGDLILTDELSHQIQTIITNYPSLDIGLDEDAASRPGLL